MLSEAQLFLAVARRGFLPQFQYRLAAVSGLVTNLFFGVLRVSVLLSVDGPRATYAFAREAISASGLIARLSALRPVRDLSVLEPDIESTIRGIYEGGLLHGAEQTR